ncbi:MAG: oligosaccharide flippase family protein [Intestinimonas sp.]
MKLDRTSMLYGTLLLTATGLVNQLLGFFYRILLSRLIGSEVMGLYQLIMPVYSVLLSVTAVGLTAAVSTLTSEYQALGNWRAAWQVLRRCLLLLLGLLALPTLGVVLFSDPISVYLLGDARTRLGLVILLPCILLTGVENLHKHAFYGAGMIRPPAFTELLEQLVRTCAVLGLLVLFLPQNPERTVGLIVTGMVICEVFSSCALTLLHRRWRRGMDGPLGAGEASGRLNHRIARIALPIAATSLLGNLMGSVCAILIPQKLVQGGWRSRRPSRPSASCLA